MALNIQQSIFSEIADFLISQPSLQDFAAYRVSESIQSYLDDLLEKNREEGLTADERRELEKILAITHLMDLAKAKAKLKLAGKT
jgi:hypothetical protein